MGSLTHYVNSRFRNPDNRRRIYLGAFLVLAVAGVYAGLNEWFPHYGNHYGLWSLAPPFVAIILAFWTREVVSSLFLGICLGGVISGEINVVQGFLIPSIGTESFALILLVYLWALGGVNRYMDTYRRCRKICHLGRPSDRTRAENCQAVYMADCIGVPSGRNH